MKKTIRSTLLVCVLSAPLLAAACTPTHSVRGNILEDYQLAEVQIGVDTQTDVFRKLGSPTTTSAFDNNIWYYLGQETEKRGILDPEVISEKIVIAEFDEQGIIQSLKEKDPNRIDVPIQDRKTPTSGNEVTVMQQFLGNIGRFNKAGGNAVNTSGGNQ